MYAAVIERTGWTLEYISNKVNLQALQLLSNAWRDENLEAQGIKTGSSNGEAVDLDPVRMPNVWDGAKEGTTENAMAFMNMLKNTR